MHTKRVCFEIVPSFFSSYLKNAFHLFRFIFFSFLYHYRTYLIEKENEWAGELKLYCGNDGAISGNMYAYINVYNRKFILGLMIFAELHCSSHE